MARHMARRDGCGTEAGKRLRVIRQGGRHMLTFERGAYHAVHSPRILRGEDQARE